jgi:hypothetical protein
MIAQRHHIQPTIKPHYSETTCLSIGHPSRPSAFTRIDSSLSFSLRIGHLNISDFQPQFRNIGHPFNKKFTQNENLAVVLEEKDCLMDQSEPPAANLTPNFKPHKAPETVRSFDIDSYNRDTIVSEFIESLEGPGTKMRTKKAAKLQTLTIELTACSNTTIEEDYKRKTKRLTPKSNGFTYCSEYTFDYFPQNDGGDHKIGRYTKKERIDKIRRYKEKVQKWLKGQNKNKDRYIKRRFIAKNKPRVGGKFIKKSA